MVATWAHIGHCSVQVRLSCHLVFCPAEASDSFSKEDMMVNGVATARSTFFDMVHPTSTKEASAHAHAVLRNNGHHAAAPAAAAPACSSVQAAAGCASTAAPAASRVPTPPMAITGVSSVSRFKDCCSGLLLHAISNLQMCGPLRDARLFLHACRSHLPAHLYLVGGTHLCISVLTDVAVHFVFGCCCRHVAPAAQLHPGALWVLITVLQQHHPTGQGQP